jgi:Transposase, Mutator family
VQAVNTRAAIINSRFTASLYARPVPQPGGSVSAQCDDLHGAGSARALRSCRRMGRVPDEGSVLVSPDLVYQRGRERERPPHLLASLEVNRRHRGHHDGPMTGWRCSRCHARRPSTATRTSFVKGSASWRGRRWRAEVSELTGLPKGERDPERRLTSRNGHRDRRWDTRVGTLNLSIPRVGDGSYFPSLLEPRRRAEWALLAVVQEAHVLGVSTRWSRISDSHAGLVKASRSTSSATPGN